MNRFRQYIALTSLLFSTTGIAEPIQLYDKKIQKIGVHENLAYISIQEGLERDCQWQNLYWDITTKQGAALYSLALMTNAASEKISSLGFHFNGDGQQCVLYWLETMK